MTDTLFKLDSKGKLRSWRMERVGSDYRTIAGLADGAKVQSGWTAAEPKNVGKANATTAAEQAQLEVEAAYALKLRKGYFKTPAEAAASTYFKPMLASDYAKRKSNIDWSGKVWMQPKLDGIRCIARASGLWTRTGKQIHSCPHIEQALAPAFEADPELIFDGELYNHKLRDDFNEIISLVRKQTCTPEHLQRTAATVQLHVYDTPSVQGDMDERFAALASLDYVKSIVVVPTVQVQDEEACDEQYAAWLQAGYEGGIIRLPGMYEHKRSKLLLKRKDFEDAEFTVTRIEPGVGNWAGAAKRVFFELEDGRECGAGLAGTKEYARELLQQRDKYIGGEVTVQFFKRTPDGVPRFPIAKALHGASRW